MKLQGTILTPRVERHFLLFPQIHQATCAICSTVLLPDAISSLNKYGGLGDFEESGVQTSASLMAPYKAKLPKRLSF